VEFLWDGLRQAWHLIITGDPYLRQVTWVTLKVAFFSTTVALVIGVPLGLVLGLGRFRGRGLALVLVNVGFVMPPVLIGLVLYLLMFPAAPLGRLHLIYTLHGVYLAQTVLAFPIVVALTSAAVQAVPVGLLAQARAFGAGTIQVGGLALREARIGVLTAAIATVGSALSEVGAIVLVGGNIQGRDETLASAALAQVAGANYAEAVAIGIILLGLMTLVIAALTFAQQRNQTGFRFRASS
jgi:tungstate transport system permease protein